MDEAVQGLGSLLHVLDLDDMATSTDFSKPQSGVGAADLVVRQLFLVLKVKNHVQRIATRSPQWSGAAGSQHGWLTHR